MIRLHRKTIYETLGREPVHPFPARMAPGIALQVISEAKKPLRVLDPMMGSGTVIALARLKGHKAIGIDIDPLAVLISSVWTTASDAEKVRNKARAVLARARDIFATLSQRNAYPCDSDQETRRFVVYWFDGYARRQLTSLAIAIGRVRDDVTRNALWCAFSRLIISKQSGASLAMDLSHSRPHKSFERAPIKPFRKFLAAVDRVLENCVGNNAGRRGPSPRTQLGDVRTLPLLDASIDLVLTSPPYLNAIDYMRCSKFSLVWMGYGIPELRRVRAESIGAAAGGVVPQDHEEVQRIIAQLRLRPPLAASDHTLLQKYIHDTLRAMREVSRVLAPEGKAVYVVGENTIKGTYVRNSVLMSEAARLCGLTLRTRRIRSLPASRRYLPPPSTDGRSAAMDTRMRREVVLSFIKPATRSASKSA